MKKIGFSLMIFLVGILIIWLSSRNFSSISGTYTFSDFLAFPTTNAFGFDLKLKSYQAGEENSGNLSGELIFASGYQYVDLSGIFLQKGQKLGSTLSLDRATEIFLDQENIYLRPTSIHIFGGSGNIANAFYTNLASNLKNKTLQIPLQELNLPQNMSVSRSDFQNTFKLNPLDAIRNQFQLLPQFSGAVSAENWEEGGRKEQKSDAFVLQGDHHIFSLQYKTAPNAIHLQGMLNQFTYHLLLTQKDSQKIGELIIQNTLMPEEKIQISFVFFPLEEKKSLQMLPNTYSSLQHYLENLNGEF